MTLVVTHTGGFLGCFTQEPDGSLRQRALIDTGQEPPTPQELAETGLVLAGTYGWQLNGHLPAPAPRKQALKEPVAAQVKALTYRAPDMDERARIIMAHIREHGPSYAPHICDAQGVPRKKVPRDKWGQTLRYLVAEGLLIQGPRHKLPGVQGPGSNLYRLPEPDGSSLTP